MRLSETNFWGMRKDIHDEPERTDEVSPVAKFDKVHVVTVVDQFISCSCGYVNQYMCPCHHVLAVLNKEEYFTYTLYHYRWWKQYDYFYLRRSTENSMMDDPAIVTMKKR